MKQFLIFILLLISTLSYSQKLKDKLQGDWVCTEILDIKGNKVPGKFGDSDKYLKFSFNKSNLSITQAPFDMGIQMPVKIKDDFIDLFPGAVFELPERIYTVKSIDNNNLVLTTKNENGQAIDYHFVNQKKFVDELKNEDRLNEDRLIDNGVILIKHLKLSKDADGDNRVSEYRIGNEKEKLFPCPIFVDSRSATFGRYFTINFVFPKTYQLGIVSQELIVEFEVTDEGVGNIRIIKGLSDEINGSVTKLIYGTSKKWEPLKVDGQIIKTRLRFHFIFYHGVMESPLKFTSS